MATFGAFINLREHDGEANRRKRILESVLAGHQPKYVHGEAKFNKYSSFAEQLAETDPQPDVFLASCWPSMDALRNNTLKGIIFTGLSDVPGQIDYAQNPRITGIKGFAAAKVCPNWLALLRQIAPSITRVAVIYDQDATHPSMQAQFDEIKKSTAPLGSPQAIHAEDADPTKRQDVNPYIKDQIKDFAEGDSPAGLIVTAGTRNMLLRKDIIDAVAAANKPTPKLFAIYPASLFVDSGGLMSYGPDLLKLYRIAAHWIGLAIELNIPSDDLQKRFPIIENQDFELVVNGSAANDLNIRIPSIFTVTIDGTSQQIKPKVV
jgi:putative ABC transport system substrate-binding protein